ncbi:MAG: ABC transporter substrate-binding protein [Phycisphaeraceae bacterium]|nr:ABC transporter substrate-binding protein [Phycisphaeraceae bacterium]
MPSSSSVVRTIRLGHSPDPDDAFMWYPLADFTGPDGQTHRPRIDTRGYRFVHVLEDIQSLNQRAEQGELEITALSIHQYPFVAERYALTACGSSMGDGYGPMVVAKADRDFSPAKFSPADLPRLRLAIPGRRTTAWLALQLFMRDHQLTPFAPRVEVVPFDQIIPAVVKGDFDLGLIIHEGQLTFSHAGLQCLVDLGRWWKDTRHLPLPLGGNAIRRDLGPQAMREIADILQQSIRYALAHREEAVRFALQWGRGLDGKLADQFVGMYVNQWTLDYGPQGRAAVRQLLAEGAATQLIPPCGAIDFVGSEA